MVRLKIVNSGGNQKVKFNKVVKKDCLAQNRFVYEFDRKIDGSFIKFLERFGEVKVFRDFAIPLIKMDVPHKIRLSALMGSNKIDVFFKAGRKKGFVEGFEKMLGRFLGG